MLEGAGNGKDSFVTEGMAIACEEAAYRGEASGNSKTLALEPEYAECTTKALTGFPADFFQELCDFLLHDLERAGNGWRAAVDLSCPAQWIGVGWDLFETEAAYLQAHPFSSLRVPKQPGIGTAELRNLPGGNGIEVRWSLDSFTYTVGAGRVPGSSLLWGSTLDRIGRDAHYDSVARVFAKDALTGAPLPFSISG